LLSAEGINNKPLRYYSNIVKIRGREYYMCSEWYEKTDNNDRTYLIKWLGKHAGNETEIHNS